MVLVQPLPADRHVTNDRLVQPRALRRRVGVGDVAEVDAGLVEEVFDVGDAEPVDGVAVVDDAIPAACAAVNGFDAKLPSAVRIARRSAATGD